jgi:uncharacterized membrane protein
MLAWFLAALLAVAGVALFVIGHLSVDDKLPRNHLAGVRTKATLQSDTAWYAGQRAAAIPMQTAGAIAIFVAVVLAAWRPDDVVAAAVGLVAAAAVIAAVVMGAVRAGKAADAAVSGEA